MGTFMNKILILTILAAINFACTSKNNVSAETSTQEPKTWNAQMAKMYASMQELLPMVYSERNFSDPKNYNSILNNTKNMMGLAHSIDQSKMDKVKSPDLDPAVSYLSTQFQRHLSHAYASIEAKNMAYGRGLLKSSLSYCMACHSRGNHGPQYDFWGLKPEFANSLTALDKVDFYAATRQYKAAMIELDKILADSKSNKAQSLEVEIAARKAIAISVRVFNDPMKANDIVMDISNSKKISPETKTDSEAWKKSISEWFTEINKSTPAPISEAEYLKEMRRLISKAEKIQEFPADSKGDIYYLRATALIHNFFHDKHTSQAKAEAAYLAGLSYGVLTDIGLWQLQDYYFEFCIREAPKSAVAKKCYKKLEESMQLGYSGSAGLNLPKAVYDYLKELKQLTK